MEQEMSQRAGNATGDPTNFGWKPGLGNGMQMMGIAPNLAQQPQSASQNPPALNQAPTTAPAMSQNMQSAVGQAAQHMNGGQQAQALGASPYAPLVRGATETIPAFNARVAEQKQQAALNPEFQQGLEEKKAAGAETPKDSEELSTQTSQAQNMLFTLKDVQTALQQVKAGALAPATVTLERYARAFNIPVDVNSLGNGQVVSKLAMNILSTAAKNEGQAARLQGAFNALKASNPNLSMEPEALNSLINFQGTQANKLVLQQKAWNDQKNANPNLDYPTFDRNYMANLSDQQAKGGGALQPYDFKQTAPLKGEQPQPIQYKSGLIRNGYVFKGGDPTQQSNWMKVK
ncbi:MAG: hypothetical protein KGL39_36970 [Patescibacteria group bacterium]|nr:hypothetical protein [Patescibacteria group bacterium]